MRSRCPSVLPRSRLLRVIGVLISPGQTAVTPTPCGRNSMRSYSERPSTANLVEVYAASVGLGK